MKIKIAGLKTGSVVDGPGLRSVIFTQGCPHHCPGCHNPQTHDPDGGEWMDVTELAAKLLSEKGRRRVTFSGGEPFLQAQALSALASILKAKDWHITIYTGYKYEELQQVAKANSSVASLLLSGDLLIDGRFDEDERDPSLVFRGSHNQRIIDLHESLRCQAVILSPLHYRGLEQNYA